MADSSARGDHAALTDPTTLTLQRVLPGPIERVWAYLTDSELRRQWLARGDMVLEPGAPFELVWRNDELSTPHSERPAGFDAEHRMAGSILDVDAPNRLVISWGEASEVAFELRADGQKVKLTIHHRRAPNRDVLLKVAAGWHTHVDVLAARLGGEDPKPFWPRWSVLRDEYDARLPA